MSGESAPYREETKKAREEDLESLGLPFYWESPGSWASLEFQDGAGIEALLEPLPGGNPRPVAVLGYFCQTGRAALFSAVPGHERQGASGSASRVGSTLQCTGRPT